MKALIRKNTSCGNPSHAECEWAVSANVSTIFKADDEGTAILIPVDEEEIDEIEVLETNFPAPSGFTYFCDLRNTGYGNILQYSHLIAKPTTSWEKIYELANTGITILVMKHGHFYSRGPKLGKSLPEDVYTSYSTKHSENVEESYDHLYGFTETIIGIASYRYFNGFIRIIAAPQRAKRMQTYKRRRAARQKGTDEHRVLRTQDLLITQLRSLHEAFVVEFIDTPSEMFLSSKLSFTAGFYHQDNDTSQKQLNSTEQSAKTRIFLVSEITRLRQACIKSRRNWRSADKSGPFRNHPSHKNFYRHFLNQFSKFIPCLLKSDNEVFSIFGKWLRYEQALEKRLQRTAETV